MVKAKIVSAINECANKELSEYYRKKLEPQHGNLNFIEEESVKVYKKGELCYNHNKEHLFKFKSRNLRANNGRHYTGLH